MCKDCEKLMGLIREMAEAMRDVLDSARDFKSFKDMPDQLPESPTIISGSSWGTCIALETLASDPQGTMEWALGLNDKDLEGLSYVDALRLRDGEINLPDGLKARGMSLIVVEGSDE